MRTQIELSKQQLRTIMRIIGKKGGDAKHKSRGWQSLSPERRQEIAERIAAEKKIRKGLKNSLAKEIPLA